MNHARLQAIPDQQMYRFRDIGPAAAESWASQRYMATTIFPETHIGEPILF
jgi:hypothetical protein